MKKLFILIALIVSFNSYSQDSPDVFFDGLETKFVAFQSVTTAERDALTPTYGYIVRHENGGSEQLEQWNGLAWVPLVGGGGTTIYTGDGSITGPRDVLVNPLASLRLGTADTGLFIDGAATESFDLSTNGPVGVSGESLGVLNLEGYTGIRFEYQNSANNRASLGSNRHRRECRVDNNRRRQF